MKFLTSESDLNILEDDILYFYSSDDFQTNYSLIFNFFYKVKNITFIDLFHFKNLHKRFDITEIPSMIILQNGVVIRKFSGPMSFDDISKIISESDIS